MQRRARSRTHGVPDATCGCLLASRTCCPSGKLVDGLFRCCALGNSGSSSRGTRQPAQTRGSGPGCICHGRVRGQLTLRLRRCRKPGAAGPRATRAPCCAPSIRVRRRCWMPRSGRWCASASAAPHGLRSSCTRSSLIGLSPVGAVQRARRLLYAVAACGQHVGASTRVSLLAASRARRPKAKTRPAPTLPRHQRLCPPRLR
jgi:hypothetical protein